MRSVGAENVPRTLLGPDALKTPNLEADALRLSRAVSGAPIISFEHMETDHDWMHALALEESASFEFPFSQASCKVNV